jgi:Zn-dependent M28 family amino/carboxypeptidase
MSMTIAPELRVALIAALLGAAGTAGAQTPPAGITADELREHVRTLASDEFEGRGAGTEGNEKAAAYIVQQFRAAGLKPAGDAGGYTQSFEFVKALELGPGNTLTLAVPTTGGSARELTLAPDADFRPLGFSSSASVQGEVVFVGYGISAPDKGYDDYAGLDVAGKVVMMLRHSPEGNNPHGELNALTALRVKARTAREKGAAAMLLVEGPAEGDEDNLMSMSYDYSFAASGIPAVQVKRASLAPLLEAHGVTLKQLQDSINASKKPRSIPFPGATASLRTDVVQVKARAVNVLGVLPGRDPAVKDEVIALGAHFDHLGWGGRGSGSLRPDEPAIHNGADDNASGSSALLELAEEFGRRASSLRRSVLFIAFNAEERGLLGSNHYVSHPTLPLARTVAMINMDMVGRLKDDQLTVYGIATSPAWDSLITRLNREGGGFSVKQVADGVGPSDHSSFYTKEVPVLFFFTGTHDDYHKPSDDWQTLNYDGHQRVARFVYRVADEIDRFPARPAFARAPVTQQSMGGDSRGFRVTLGVVPDYTEGSTGMKIGGIRPGGAADKAGMKSGDVIVKMGGKNVLNIYDYMAILGELKAGEEVEVEFLRGTERMNAKAVMEKRQ